VAIQLTSEDLAASRIIEAAREERGMSKAELARRSGFSVRTIKNYLYGDTAMTLGTFWSLCHILGVSREEAADRLRRELVTSDDTEE
jgi:Helix-turn-helix.